MLPCWKCHAETGGLICAACRSLQPPPRDYFAFFGVPEALAPDRLALEKRFYELSRLLHPDRFVRRDERERAYSTDATAVLNDGWRTLRDPVARGEYVLSRHGFPIGEQKTANVPPELLEEVFELNEWLEEIRHGDDSHRTALGEAHERFTAMLAQIDRQLEDRYRAFDAGGGRSVLENVRGLLNRRRYIRNLVRDVESALAPAA
ncbi:MAG: Fe-S protein assembly co-chaperone HscB [Bryobacterales bacterium]|nr:Fe-S protein assembly co-chaperone HscB [Bryobacterales bacterium]